MAPASAAVLAVSVARYVYFHRARQALTDKDTIVLAEFTNTTGDRCSTEPFARDWRSSSSSRRSSASFPTSAFSETLRLMGQPADARLTPDVARDICERTASAAVLEGSIATLGSQYVLGLRARNCRTGDILDRGAGAGGQKGRRPQRSEPDRQ